MGQSPAIGVKTIVPSTTQIQSHQAQRFSVFIKTAIGARMGFAPPGEYLSFVSPKERYERKGDPIVCDPERCSGQPALLA
ncbi:hypothetical protein, partial [Methylobacillus sp. Pita1]|uniref:hypothetical protein n=1 Tax=Methylobacillus sp. Pita1 TaxID=3382642 RepID=UPI0038B6B007